MADLARKQLMVTNPSKKKTKKKKAHGKKRHHARRHNPGKPHRKRARRHSAPRHRRSSGRRKNPSFGHAALSTGAAVAVGAGAAVLSQVAAHLLGDAAANAEEPKPKLATALRIGAPAVIALGAGLGLSMVNQTVGKAAAAGAAAVSALQATSAIAAHLGAHADGSANALQKGGLQLLAGDEFNIKGSHVYRRLPNGSEQLLFGATPRGWAKLKVNGQEGRWGVLGNLGQRSALVVSPGGQMQVLSGYQFDGLAGYQTDNME